MFDGIKEYWLSVGHIMAADLSRWSGSLLQQLGPEDVCPWASWFVLGHAGSMCQMGRFYIDIRQLFSNETIFQPFRSIFGEM